MKKRSETHSLSGLEFGTMGWFTTRVLWLRQGVKAWRQRRRRTQDGRGLRAMDDRELNDLGIGRGEIGRVMLGDRR